MTDSRPLVIQTEHLDKGCRAWLSERCRVETCSSDDPAFPALLPEADGLVIRTYTNIDSALLESAPKLRVVGRAGVGLDNIDLDACKARSVRVVHTPAANTRAVVELVLAFMLDALRPRVFLNQPLSKDDWKAVRRELIAPRMLADLTIGIIGLGKIGSQVARVCSALNMRVLAADVAPIAAEARLGAEQVSHDAVYAQSDIITVHVDSRPENRHLINAQSLAKMKNDVVLINTSRGFVVDAAALAKFLGKSPEAVAVLDVHDPEPIEADNPLLGLDNAHLSPHIAAATATAHRNMSRVVEDIWRVLNDQQPVSPAV